VLYVINVETMRLQPLGDSALILDFADESSDADELLRRALTVAEVLERAQIPGVIEITSAYQSVALFLDLSGVATAAADRQIEDFLNDRIASALAAAGRAPKRHVRSVDIPVCYDGEFALDLARVAEQVTLNPSEVIALHLSAKYTTACIGFMPGFPFLAGLPKQLHLPRLATPRTHVPAGSVAIAGAQSGIYPLESPGGWNVIGRTPIQLFDPKANPPALLRAGDQVRFRAITRDEFNALLR
jgi:inhibitor of KinA